MNTLGRIAMNFIRARLLLVMSLSLGVLVQNAVVSTAAAAPTIEPLGSPRILIADTATKTRLQGLLSANAPSALRFKNLVDAEIGGANAYAFEPWYAALLAQLTGNAAYCTFAVSRTESFVASEEALIAANQRAAVAGDSYLEVGPFIGNLAMVYDWCRGSMSAAQRTRWVNYGNQAVWNVWHHQQAVWGSAAYPWSGWSVDNPANNYYYSFLQATMLLGLATHGENAQAQGWLDKFRTDKLENQLFPLFNSDLQGGGSREGTGYGTALRGLFSLYLWWEKSTGERIADKTPHTLDSIGHLLHNIVPTLDRLAPTGDHARDSSAELFDYHRDYLQILMKLYPTQRIAGVAKTLLAQSSVPVMYNGFMVYSDFLYDQSDVTAKPLSELSTARWGSGTGQFPMRSAWANTATYANLICGPYSESHAHHDQGSFVLFKGNWLAFDENIFSHSGLSQTVTAHNLVRIEQNNNPIGQTYNTRCEMLALADNANFSYGLARVTPAYAGKAAVVKVEREFLFLKPGTLVIFDRVQTSGAGIRRVWTLNLPLAPTVSGDRLSMVNGSNRLDVFRLSPAGLTSQVIGWPSVDSDMNAGYRVDVADTNTSASSFLNVLGTDNAVSSALRSDGSGQTGAQIALADGRSALVRFNTTGTGGTLEIRNAANAVVHSAALPTTVSAPLVFVDQPAKKFSGGILYLLLD